MMKACIVFMVALWVSVLADAPCEFPAQTESGTVCGTKRKAIDGSDYISFQGIPYAKPPVGKLRFAEPQKPDPFTGVFNASEHGFICPQLINELGSPVDPETTSEDCLTINVYMPKYFTENGTIKPLIPVLVQIHGGSFAKGSGDSDFLGPEYLMTKNIGVVTFNYRLNSIGFLSLASKYIPGNTGLRDSLFALKWVKRNIKNFGGDPDNVTLGGQSAGGVLVGLLALSPATKNLKLFKRIMVLSGNAVPSFYSPSPLFAKYFADKFIEGMKISRLLPDRTIHDRITSAPIADILRANLYVEKETGFFAPFAPVIENKYDGFTTIVPDDPEDLINDSNGNEFPAIIGFTNNECYVFKPGFVQTNLMLTMKKYPFATVPFGLLLASNVLTIPILTKKISNEYFNNTSPTLDKFVNLCTDGLYKYPSLRWASKRVARGAEPTYLYEFGYQTESEIYRTITNNTWRGATHSEDLASFMRINFMMGPMLENELAQPTPDSMMREWMTTFVSNFAKTGVPATDPDGWPATGPEIGYQGIYKPMKYNFMPISGYLKDKKIFFDNLWRTGRLEIFDKENSLKRCINEGVSK